MAGIALAGMHQVSGSQISGKVTASETGQALAGIEVSVYEFGRKWSWQDFAWRVEERAWTDADGNYVVEGLGAGTYRVGFIHEGRTYAREYYNNAVDVDSAADIVLAADGEGVSGIDASLEPSPHLSGTVTASDGITPLEDIHVSAYEWRDSYGGYWSKLNLGEFTDENGEFTFDTLDPGTYRFQFEDFEDNFSTLFYPGVEDVDSATSIELLPGAVVTGVDASLTGVAGISGNVSVTDADGTSPMSYVDVKALRWDPSGYWDVVSTETNSDGAYAIKGIEAGTWRIQFDDFGFYDGAVDEDAATEILVPEETIVTNVDANFDITGDPLALHASSESGFFPAGHGVTLSCGTPGATIRYTVDGSDPDANAPVLPEGETLIVVTENSGLLLKARAYNDDQEGPLLQRMFSPPHATSRGIERNRMASNSFPRSSLYYNDDRYHVREVYQTVGEFSEQLRTVMLVREIGLDWTPRSDAVFPFYECYRFWLKAREDGEHEFLIGGYGSSNLYISQQGFDGDMEYLGDRSDTDSSEEFLYAELTENTWYAVELWVQHDTGGYDGVWLGLVEPSYYEGESLDWDEFIEYSEQTLRAVSYLPVGDAGRPPLPVEASPMPGVYGVDQAVTLDLLDSEAAMFYTLDGSDPAVDGIPYDSAIALSEGRHELRVFAKDGDREVSMALPYHIQPAADFSREGLRQWSRADLSFSFPVASRVFDLPNLAAGPFHSDSYSWTADTFSTAPQPVDDGSTRALHFDSVTALESSFEVGSPFTLVMAIRPSGVQTADGTVVDFGEGTFSGTNDFAVSAEGGVYLQEGPEADDEFDPLFDVENPEQVQIFAVTHSENPDGADTLCYSLELGGVAGFSLVDSIPPNKGEEGEFYDQNSTVVIGASPYLGSESFLGSFHEFMFFDKQLSQEELALLESYFRDRFPPTVSDPPLRPEISPAGGVYLDPVEVGIIGPSDAGVVVHYSLDGSMPDASSPVLEAGQTLTVSSDAILRAVTIQGGLSSEIETAEFRIRDVRPVISAPVWDGEPLTESPQSVFGVELRELAVEVNSPYRLSSVQAWLIDANTSAEIWSGALLPEGGGGYEIQPDYQRPVDVSDLLLRFRATDQFGGQSDEVYLVTWLEAVPPIPTLLSPNLANQNPFSSRTVVIRVEAPEARRLEMEVNGLRSSVASRDHADFDSWSAVLRLENRENELRLRAENDSGFSEWSNIYLFERIFEEVPVVSDVVLTTDDDGGFLLSWDAINNSRAAAIEVFAAPSAFADEPDPLSRIAELSAETSQLSIDSSMEGSSLYFAFRVISESGAKGELRSFGPFNLERIAPSVLGLSLFQSGSAVDSGFIGVGAYTVELTLSEALKEDAWLRLTDAGGRSVRARLEPIFGFRYEATFSLGPDSLNGPLDLAVEGTDRSGLPVEPLSPEIGEGWTGDTVGSILVDYAMIGDFPVDLSGDPQTRVLQIEASENLAEAKLYLMRGDTPPISMEETDDLVYEALVSFDSGSWLDDGESFVQVAFYAELIDSLGNVRGVNLSSPDWIVGEVDSWIPPAPGFLTGVTQAAGAVSLTWEEIPAVQAYRLYRRPEGYGDFMEIASLVPGLTSWTDLPSADGLYDYAIQAVRVSPADGATELVSSFRLSVPIDSDRVLPGTPVNLEAAVVGSGVALGWALPQGDEAETDLSFVIERQSGLDGDWERIGTTQGVSWLDADASRGLNSYRVSAVDFAGNQSVPSAVEVVDVDVLAPREFVGTFSEESGFVLTWEAPDGGADAYRVSVGERVMALPGTATSLVDDFFRIESEAIYRLQASKNGLWSEAVEVKVRNVALTFESELVFPENSVARNSYTLVSRSAYEMERVSVEVLAGDDVFKNGEFPMESGAVIQGDVQLGGSVNPGECLIRVTVTDQTGGAFILESIAQLKPVQSQIERKLTVRYDQSTHLNHLELYIKNNSAFPLTLRTAGQFGAIPGGDLVLHVLDASGIVMGSFPVIANRGPDLLTNSKGQTLLYLEPGKATLLDLGRFRVGFAEHESQFFLECLQLWHAYGEKEERALRGFALREDVIDSAPPFQLGLRSVDEVDAGNNTLVEVVAEPIMTGYRLDGRQILIRSVSDGSPVHHGVVTLGPEGSATTTLSIDRPGTHVLEAFDPLLEIQSPPRLIQVNGLVFVHPEPTCTGLYGHQITARFTLQGQLSGGETLELMDPSVLPDSLLIEFGDWQRESQERWSVPIHLRSSPNMGDSILSGTVGVVLKDAEGATLDSSLLHLELHPEMRALDFADTFDAAAALPAVFWSREMSLRNIGSAEIRSGLRLRLRSYGEQGEEILVPDWIRLASDLSDQAFGVNASKPFSILANVPAEADGENFDLAVVAEVDGEELAIHPFAFYVRNDATGSVSLYLTDVFTGTENPAYNPADPSVSDPTPLYEGVYDVMVILDPLDEATEPLRGFTDGYGRISFPNVPVGQWYLRLNKQGYDAKSFFLSVEPGMNFDQEIFMVRQLIEVTWSVEPTQIEDRYSIRTVTTFEQDVPAGLLVVEPMHINLPPMCPGDVYQGELTLMNVGLARLFDVGVNEPFFGEGLNVSFLDPIPEIIEAGEIHRVRFRVEAGSGYLANCP